MADMQGQAAGFAADLLPADGGAEGAAPRRGQQDMSIAGVLLLSVVAVVLAILSVVWLGLMVMGAWWLLSHVPVPAAVRHLLALL
jgi:hypothetical protein